MGKRLTQQRRGGGSPVFTAPHHLFAAEVMFRSYDQREKESCVRGQVVGFLDDPARSALLMNVLTDEKKVIPLIAPEGIAIGDPLQFGSAAEVAVGNILPLSSIPDGTPVYDIELVPGDGGKLVRTAGSSAYVISHTAGLVYVSLPSKSVKTLDGACRAQVGIVSGGGRLDRPIFKAGKMAKMVKPTALRWPNVRGVAMNAVAHPFGGHQHHPGRSTISARNSPPGQKVGLVGAASVGRGKGKRKA